LSEAERTDGAQLLVVDDEAFFSAFVKEKFEELGYSVATAADAFEALDFVGRWPAPLVVLLDLKMPRVSGEGLLQELARSHRAATIRVVLVSASHTVERIAVGHPMVAGRAQKPIDLGELTRMVVGATRALGLSTGSA
jgi:two-component system, response regulator, stage 0 sporulation protein F